MSQFRFRTPLALWLGAVMLAAAGSGAQDTDGAERQYRVARRLAAEGSPQALEALRKVLELDPAGPLADDALVDEALLIGLPRWPEELGRLNGEQRTAAMTPLQRVRDTFAQSDRSDEAAYYLALLKLEPMPGRDADSARLELLALATARPAHVWSRSARYALAWLAALDGDEAAAVAGLQRLLVDGPNSQAAQRARVALARIELRAGEAGPAAARLQRAIDQRVAAETGAAPLRDLAVRALLPEGGPQPVTQALTVRGLVGLAPIADGRVAVGEDRSSSVLAVDPDGTVVERWSIPDLVALAPSALRRDAFAADETRLFRLASGRPPAPIAVQGDFAPIRSLYVGHGGRVWVTDKRGDRIGVLDPGADAPRVLVDQRGSKFSDLTWDGRRLLVLEGKGRRVRAFDADGTSLEFAGPEFIRPAAISSDGRGRVAVLDTRPVTLSILGADGALQQTLPLKSMGLSEPVDVRFGMDGVLHLFDKGSGQWVQIR